MHPARTDIDGVIDYKRADADADDVAKLYQAATSGGAGKQARSCLRT